VYRGEVYRGEALPGSVRRRNAAWDREPDEEDKDFDI